MSLRSDLMRLTKLWFSASVPVDRRSYAFSGFGLMALKYVLDAGFVGFVTGHFWSPVEWLAPRMLDDWKLLSGWAALALFALGLPFMWIGISMTIRRGADAGFSVWAGLLFFVPVVNYVWMLALCALPPAVPAQLPAKEDRPRARAIVLQAALPAAVLGVACAGFSIFLADSYGAVLFVGVPFAMGFSAAYRARRLGGKRWQGGMAAALSVLIVAGLMLLLALEGGVCLAMAAPLALIVAAMGSFVGNDLARAPAASAAQVLLLFAVLPVLMGAEGLRRHLPLREVVSTIEIDASPERVWPHVVGFTELPPPQRWVFELGIAYPQHARIEGSGVGAVRYCEFSTGPFVEPITAWEAPRRLAFDVAAQPEPMHEWSPYQFVHAPHLVDGMQSQRGEFRLVPLPGGRTRLEGGTWYTLDMAPAFYWSWISDALLHSIHDRVLDHVKRLAEADAQPADSFHAGV